MLSVLALPLSSLPLGVGRFVFKRCANAVLYRPCFHPLIDKYSTNFPHLYGQRGDILSALVCKSDSMVDGKVRCGVATAW